MRKEEPKQKELVQLEFRTAKLLLAVAMLEIIDKLFELVNKLLTK